MLKKKFLLFLVALLSLEACSPSFTQITREISYDDGTPEGYVPTGFNRVFAVRFTPVFECYVSGVKMYVKTGLYGIQILDKNLKVLAASGPVQVRGTGWHAHDFTMGNLTFKEDFYVAVEVYSGKLGYDESSESQNRSYVNSFGGWKPSTDVNYMIRVIITSVEKKRDVSKFSSTVGGFLSREIKNSTYVYGSIVDLQLADKMKQGLGGRLSTRYDCEVDDHMVVVGGPIASLVAQKYCGQAGIAFRKEGENIILSISGMEFVFKSGEWARKDYSIISLTLAEEKLVLIVAGCTRYGTKAAVLYLLSTKAGLNQKKMVLSWEDLNNNREVEFKEVSVIYGG